MTDVRIYVVKTPLQGGGGMFELCRCWSLEAALCVLRSVMCRVAGGPLMAHLEVQLATEEEKARMSPQLAASEDS